MSVPASPSVAQMHKAGYIPVATFTLPANYIQASFDNMKSDLTILISFPGGEMIFHGPETAYI